MNNYREERKGPKIMLIDSTISLQGRSGIEIGKPRG
jgi:hypothetical protein